MWSLTCQLRCIGVPHHVLQRKHEGDSGRSASCSAADGLLLLDDAPLHMHL